MTDDRLIDAWGITGTIEECLTRNGSGVEYAERCLECGGYGYTCEPVADQLSTLSMP